jgi:hypothetical protein
MRFGHDFGADAGSSQVTAVNRMDGMVFQRCGNQTKLLYSAGGKVHVKMAVETDLPRVGGFSVTDEIDSAGRFAVHGYVAKDDKRVEFRSVWKCGMVKLAKKNGRLIVSLPFSKSFGEGALMTGSSTASTGPKVKEVHALNFHEANVDH